MKLNFLSTSITVLLATLLLTSSCRLPSNELSPEEMDIVDTLYNARIPLYRGELDSICDLMRDSLIQLKTDSLVELQLAEIRKLVNRQ